MSYYNAAAFTEQGMLSRCEKLGERGRNRTYNLLTVGDVPKPFENIGFGGAPASTDELF